MFLEWDVRLLSKTRSSRLLRHPTHYVVVVRYGTLLFHTTLGLALPGDLKRLAFRLNGLSITTRSNSSVQLSVRRENTEL